MRGVKNQTKIQSDEVREVVKAAKKNVGFGMLELV